MIQIEYRTLLALVAYDRNSRKHPRAQVDALKASLAEFGWVRPIAIADGVVIYGHGVLEAALELAHEGKAIPRNPDPWQGPTVDLSALDPLQRRAYVIADNKLAQGSEWIDELLTAELGELSAASYPLELTGFDLGELDSLLGGGVDNTPPAPASEAPIPEGSYTEQYGVIVICRDAKHQQEVYEALQKDGHTLRVVTT